MTRENPESISVVIPCFNEELVLNELRDRILNVLKATGIKFEVIFIDDGSTDRTWEILSEFRKTHREFKTVKLSRNFGHQNALTCGIDQAKGDVVLIIDADLQDPPELLPEMISKWREGYDIIYGQRTEREGEHFSKKILAYLFYRVISQVTKVDIPADTGDFRLMSSKAVSALKSLRERHRFIRGMVSWVGFNQTAIRYKRPQRAGGKTKYPFRKSLLLAIDAITSFSYLPLRFASFLGAALSIFSFLYIFIVIALKFLGINFPGYTSIMASILLLGGVQLLVLGIIGEYVGRIFEQGQNRPLYIIESINGEPLSPIDGS